MVITTSRFLKFIRFLLILSNAKYSNVFDLCACTGRESCRIQNIQTATIEIEGIK